MPLLYFWRRDNYLRDLDLGAGYHLNQTSPTLHTVGRGDSLWAFTRDARGRYVLAAELVVRATTRNPPGFRYGPYRVWGDLRRSRYFRVEADPSTEALPPSAEALIRSFPIPTRAKALGRSFQGRAAVRQIAAEAHRALRAFAQDLPTEPRARVFPEERLEAALVTGDHAAARALVREEDPGYAAERRAYLYEEAPTRNRHFAEKLRDLYDGRCQICRWHPRGRYEADLCHAHHIHWLSRGGADEMSNLMLVCPNHHAAIHRIDAPLDWADFAFDFGTRRERVLLDRHLRA